ncbi:gliding motility-associated C-terminal domain-containing protein [Labilibaculum manganireducens]|nr:gliding motility-associated C-terminal domain-containing protein [Labilibaculum manganireducens]
MTIFRCSLLVIFAILSNPIFSQITAPTATYSSVTQYASSPQDDIFVFCDNIGAGVGELKAVSNDGTSGWTFTWTKWDSGTGTFAIPIPSVDTSTESILTNLPDGLYKVEATNGVNSFNDQAWVLNRLASSQQPNFSLSRRDCAGIFFNSSFGVIQLKYQDITTKDEILLPATYVFELTREGLSVQRTPLIDYDGSVKSFFDGEAFEGKKNYVLTVTDECGRDYVSSMISSETYVVKAEFTVKPKAGEAPLEVEFTNESVNADDFEWFIYQDFDRIADAANVEDSLLVDGIITDEGPIAYTYLHPGNYFVKLIASSENVDGTCIDEFNFKAEGTPIVVDTSLVQVPNVFTPNGDGRNDIFRVKSQSLKSFSGTIINRWGRVVFSWKNPDEGWNGKINGKWATPGTYFYVITATGREEQKKKYTKKGSFMLIRK